MDLLSSKLPDELILAICEKLAAESTKSLVRLCQTSKRFYRLAHPFIYTDVRLKSHYGPESALLRFASIAQQSRRSVKSLDIRFTRGHMSAFKIGLPSATTNLGTTLALLPGLHRLTTIILQLDHNERRNTLLPDSVVASFLNALPGSVKNLEIVTEGLDKLGWQEAASTPVSCHCTSISKLLPKLHHLRVRKGYLCSNMCDSIQAAINTKLAGDDTTPWPLRSLAIRLDMEGRYISGHAIIPEEPVSTSYCSNPQAMTSASILAAPFREAIEAGLLSELQFAKITSRMGNTASLCSARGTKHSGFATYDIVGGHHMLLPVLAVEVNLRNDTQRDTESQFGDLYLVRDEDGIDHFGSWAELMGTFEYKQDFRDRVRGHAREHESHDISGLPSRNEFALPKDLRMGFWLREKKIGQILLTARRIDGLGALPPFVEELLPSGWKYGANNKKREATVERIDGRSKRSPW